MKLKDFIAELHKYDQELIVCLADWQEQYMKPNESAAESMQEEFGFYKSVGVTDDVHGPFLCIGR